MPEGTGFNKCPDKLSLTRGRPISAFHPSTTHEHQPVPRAFLAYTKTQLRVRLAVITFRGIQLTKLGTPTFIRTLLS